MVYTEPKYPRRPCRASAPCSNGPFRLFLSICAQLLSHLSSSEEPQPQAKPASMMLGPCTAVPVCQAFSLLFRSAHFGASEEQVPPNHCSLAWIFLVPQSWEIAGTLLAA